MSCTNEKKRPDRILTYGLPSDNIIAMEITGKKWGIEIYPVAGCMVSQQLIDSVDKVHIELWKKMDMIHGNESEKKFDEETKVERKRINEAQKIFESDEIIKSKILKIKNKNTYYSELEKVSEDGNLYYWIVNSFTQTYETIPEFKLSVNLKDKKAEIINSE